jgi:hypothetical protein
MMILGNMPIRCNVRENKIYTRIEQSCTYLIADNRKQCLANDVCEYSLPNPELVVPLTTLHVSRHKHTPPSLQPTFAPIVQPRFVNLKHGFL